MGPFCKAQLLSLVVLCSRLSLQENFAGSISSQLAPVRDELAKCLVVIISDLQSKFVRNIAIRWTAESTYTRRDFIGIVRQFCALTEAIPIELDADESRFYDIQIRIYFIDSLYSLQLLVNRQRERDTDLLAERQNYIIVLPKNIENPELLMEQIFEFCWSRFIINVNIVVEYPAGNVTLYTYYPFNERNCKDWTPIFHNSFVDGRFELDKEAFPPKTKNMWKCAVKFVFWHEQKDFTKTHEEALATLADIMNFTVEYVLSTGQLGFVNINGTNFTGSFKMLNDSSGDINNCICTAKLHRYFAAAGPHRYINLVLIVRWPEAFSPLEILFFPFDVYTWLALFVFFVGKSVTWLLWQRISTHDVPHRNFIMRLHIMPWLFSILILRSSYEGSIFKFLSQRPRRSPPRNVDEAIQQGFKFIVHPRLYALFEVIDELKDNLVVFEDTFEATLDFFDQSKKEYALIDLEDSLELFAEHPGRRHKYFISQKYILVNLECYYLAKFSYLTAELNRRLGQIRAHGYFEKFFKMSISVQDFQTNTEGQSERGQAKLHQLMGAFQLLIVLMGISVCLFLLELLTKHCHRLRAAVDLFY